MTAFQSNRKHIEQGGMLNFLEEIEENPLITQRSLAQEFRIARRLMKAYLKHSFKKMDSGKSSFSKLHSLFPNFGKSCRESKIVKSYLDNNWLLTLELLRIPRKKPRT